MEIAKLYIKASEDMERFIRGVKREDLDKQSVCSEWIVRDLINHILSETLWAPDLLAKKTITEVGDKYDGDLLGEDFKKEFNQAKQKAVEAFSKSDALDGDVHVSWGDIPAVEYAEQMLFDMVVHGWDVAKSTNQDDSLDPELVEWTYEWSKGQQKMMRESNVVGVEVEVEEDSDLQTKMLGMLGRKR